MKILFIASECAPIIKVGGLADVAGSLPKSLKELGVDISVIIPFYGAVKNIDAELVKKDIKIDFEGKQVSFSLFKTKLPESDVALYLIKNNDYFYGDVYVETDASSGGSREEAARFLFFSKACAEIAGPMNFNLLHCNDWHVGIIPLLIKRKKEQIKTLLTIHNIGYQGVYSEEIINSLLGLNFKNEVNCLRQGIINADFINTVSENYAKEILTPEFGFGLENDLIKRKDVLTGILNGLDLSQFNPLKDPHIAKNYDLETLEEKIENKKFLQQKLFNGVDLSVPIIGMVSRLAEQKGLDLLREIMPRILEKNIHLAILGKGVRDYENFFVQQARQNPEKIFVEIGFNEALARQIYAGSDIFLMPSRFEPCGLGQLIAMRYGTVPIVRTTGGLKDTVLPAEEKSGTGFLFNNYNSKELLDVIERALEFYDKKGEWRRIQENGMRQDFSWERSALKYKELYQKLITDLGFFGVFSS